MAALALSGCSYGDDLLDLATGTTAATNTSTPDTASPSTPSTTTSNPQPGVAAAASAPASTTLLGMKLPSLRADVAQFQGNVAHRQADFAATRESLGNNASSYSNIVAAVDTRLRAGTTESNPELVAQWSQAQSLLDQMNGGVAHLFSISNDTANDSSLGNYILKELRAARDLRGGTDSDRDELKQLETQTTSSIAQADQLHTAVTGEIAHQNAYIAGERNNLTALALAIQNGRSPGPNVAGRPVAAAAAAGPHQAEPRHALPRRAAAARRRPHRARATGRWS